MKVYLVVCSVLLFLGLLDLPIGYYTLLRIVVTIGAVIVILNGKEKGLSPWNIIFGLIAILFNPILPIYLGNKEAWMPIDFVVGLIFMVMAVRK